MSKNIFNNSNNNISNIDSATSTLTAYATVNGSNLFLIQSSVDTLNKTLSTGRA